MEEQVISLEHALWEAVLHQNTAAFQELVFLSAVMICGGCRCLGSEYAGIIADFFISSYTITHMEVIYARPDQVMLHYVLQTEVADSRDRDLAGTFHVASVWGRHGDSFKLLFNMDSKIVQP